MALTREFLELINEIVDQKLESMDRVVSCQICSNDDGTDIYSIKLLSDPNTRIDGVINCSKFSFKSGDFAYILKIKNDLANCFIIAKNNIN